ncbi:MAG: IS66 family transposase [Gemmataceae bacterium]
MTVGKINVTEALKNAEKVIREDKSLSPQARAMMELLVLVITLLAQKLGLNSSNSSKPPSQDPKRTRGSKKKTKGHKRKPGGQKGHEGVTLKPVPNPDRVETLEIDRRTLPRGSYTQVGFETRQVIDIQITSEVVEYRAEILEDENGAQFVADFPPGVRRPVQYGPSVKAHAVYMSQFQLLPYDRIRDYFADQCGLPLSAGSIFNFNKEAYVLLGTFEAIVKKQLVKQGLLHADETGINVNGKTLWLHTLGNDQWTLFFPHARRGAEAMRALGVLKKFKGILCHDHWKPYFVFGCLHALCNAHHLRELERAWEQDNQTWAKNMQALLLEINEAVHAAGGCLSDKAAKGFRARYRNILTRGDRECPAPKKVSGKPGRTARSKSRNLLERLREFEVETLRFMTDKRVPFTNNQGENDIRMTKVQQKISGCFRSFDGAQMFCRIRSYLSTCRKQGVDPTDALQLLFDGKLPDFVRKLE